MAERWELSEKQWLLVEPVLRPAPRAVNRCRPWHDTRAVLNGVPGIEASEAAMTAVDRLGFGVR